MPEQDIATTISAADRLLATTENPRHRQILENYRRHAILEVCGEWEAIFAPDMMVEHPVYHFNITGLDGVVADGAEAVKAIYRQLAETQTCVMLVEDEQLWVDDWGFASDSTFITYLRGSDAIGKGFEVDDPDGFYREHQHFAMIWPYDEAGRLQGEHVYENKALHGIEPVAAEDFLTVADARARLLPLLRPLPPLLNIASNGEST
ncbi:hypothetical protein [Pseudonocardia spinosispora]|uniref:hypothetical protein n=1 Tax=Pseudonocardia spinosispora TaxID=103441 RepID=UPI0004087F33|nr:hypothetical protein [Pseudonocardia spinosispora]